MARGNRANMSHGSHGYLSWFVVRWAGLSRVHAVGCHLSYDKAAVICMHLSLDLQIATVALRLLRCSSLCTDSRVSSWSLNGEQGFYRHSLIEFKSARIARTLRVVGCISMAKKAPRHSRVDYQSAPIARIARDHWLYLNGE